MWSNSKGNFIGNVKAVIEQVKKLEYEVAELSETIKNIPFEEGQYNNNDKVIVKHLTKTLREKENELSRFLYGSVYVRDDNETIVSERGWI